MVTLIILDGFGFNKHRFGNAIKCAGTPNLDKLTKKYPHTLLKASGEAVGLPEGTMGNSEVGHLTLGAGKMIPQSLMQIDNAIKDGSFFSNPYLIKALDYAEKNGRLHLLGLLSDIGVHADINHLFAILKASKDRKIKEIYIHAWTDGRDCGVHDAVKYINMTQEFLKKEGLTNVKFASIMGRVFPMDREKRFDRVKKAYETMVNGKNYQEISALDAVQKSYNSGVTDEFIEPVLLDKNGVIKNKDAVILYNFRSDRGREITDAFTNPNFKEFSRKKLNFFFTQMCEYSENSKDLNTLFPPPSANFGLAKILSEHGLKQYHIAETSKYVHVTYYFNGGGDDKLKGETRKCIPTIDAPDFSYYPKMRAYEITDESLDAIASGKYDFVLINLSNPDMIGHTGNFNSAVEAIKCVEKLAYAITLATLMAGGECVITADHGNAEIMIDKKGNKVTSHTTSPVPFILVSERYKNVHLKKNRTIASVAPTILKLFNIDRPTDMVDPLF